MSAPTISQTLEVAYQHHQAGRLPEAEALYREILDREPRCAEARHHLGLIALQVGQYAVAAELIRDAAVLAPGDPAIHSNLGETCRLLGRYDEAVASLSRALVLQPGFPGALINLALVHAAQGRLEEAEACARRAVALQPALANAHNTLGSILRELGRIDEAFHCFQQAVALDPDSPEAHNNLGLACQDRGQPGEAIPCYRRTLALQPGYTATHSNLILALLYQSDQAGSEIETELRRWNERHGRLAGAGPEPILRDRSPDRRLRVGYVSADFRQHSVAFFLLPLLEARDRTRCHVTCFSTNPKSDGVTARFRACADAWVSLVGRSDDAAAQQIRGEGIDILVDVSGHTAGNRLAVFARRPAPIQVSFLGFPASTGLSAIDCRLTDVWADPPATAEYYSERLVRLAGGGWCFTPLSGSPAVSGLPALARGHVTFGCFNHLAKVTEGMLHLWVRILRQTPESRLVLKNVALSSAFAAQRLRAFFVENGISAERVDLMPYQAAALDHLCCHDRVDVALDTFPYHGTTTTCEALWMGVPVITLAGDRHLSRVGVSLLTGAGLTEFVTPSAEAYVEAAGAAARDLPRLAALRASLRERLRCSPLMDAPRLARELDAAYRTMWRDWCEQPSPNRHG